MHIEELRKYERVQGIAKDVIADLSTIVMAGMSEADIADAANELMRGRGIDSFWYHNVGALVLAGDRTRLSISGRDYTPSKDSVVAENDLVTVDLSPQLEHQYWGDYARSFVVKDGAVAENVKKDSEHFNILGFLDILHEGLVKLAKPSMTFGELYYRMNQLIGSYGLVNLDFKHNLGHSIEKDINRREYIEDGNNILLGEVKLFTFEPHVAWPSGKFGYKREDIYHFNLAGGLRRI